MSNEEKTKSDSGETKGKKPEWRYDPDLEKSVGHSIKPAVGEWHLEVSGEQKVKSKKQSDWESDPDLEKEADNYMDDDMDGRQ